MNNIFHINLGGIPLTIDEDAYELLKEYLLELHKHFDGSDEKEEITDGIEQRLGEILAEPGSNGNIVNLAMVEHAIKLMGRPSDFQDAEEPHAEEEENTSSSSFSWDKLKFGRRLFRDPDDNVLGGVCSGLSAYLGIKDPVFMRFVFLILIFGFGVSVFFYLLLWIIIPEAKSNSDRLEMRGEPVNIDNLSKIITEQANRLGKKFQDFGDDISGKMGHKNFATGKGFTNSKMNISEDFTKNIIVGIKKGFEAIKKVVGSAGLFYFAILWILLFVGINKGFTALDLIPGTTGTLSVMTAVSLALMIGLPIFYFGYKFSQLIFKSRLNSTVSGLLVGLWIASLIGFSYIVNKTVVEYSKSSTITETVTLDNNYETIQFNGLIKPFINHEGINDIKIDIDEDLDELVGIETDIKFRESTNGELYYQVNKSARGKDQKLASQRAQSIDLELNQKGNEVEIPLNLQLAVNNKFVAQSGEITIYIPKGLNIRFDDQVMDRVPYFMDMENCSEYQLTDDGFSCAELAKQVKSEPVQNETVL